MVTRGGGRPGGASRGRASAPKRKAGSTRAPELDSDMYDEVDHFHKSRDKVSLGANVGTDSDDDSDEVGVLDLPDSEDEDESEEEEDEEDDGSDHLPNEKAWGKKKSDYYSTDFIDEDLGSDFAHSESDADEEEKEALRLQRAQAEQLDEDDFGAPELLSLPAQGKAARSKADEGVVEAVTSELDAIRLGRGAEIVTVTKDVSGMSETEKLEMLMKDSPELLELLSDFKDMMQQLRTELHPIQTSDAAQGREPRKTHADYVDVKYHLLLSYCSNISYYMMLKARGRVVKDHPVIKQLVRQRELMEKLKPVDAKVKTQLGKLLEQTGAPSRGGDADPRGEKGDASRASHAKSKKRKAQTSQKQKHMPEEESDDEYMDIPTREFSAKTKKAAYAEEKFVPGQARQAKVGRKDVLADFGEAEDAGADFAKKRKQLAAAERGSAKGKAKPTRSADEDVPRKAQRSSKGGPIFDDDSDGYDEMPGAKHALDYDHGDAGGSGAEEGEDDLYEVVKTSRKKRKEERDAAHVRVAEYLPEEEAEEKRGINYQMSKNKGLTPHRKIKNPRVKGKIKFAKALVKRKHQVRQHTSGAAGASYGGETSGLKKNLARSVKL